MSTSKIFLLAFILLSLVPNCFSQQVDDQEIININDFPEKPPESEPIQFVFKIYWIDQMILDFKIIFNHQTQKHAKGSKYFFTRNKSTSVVLHVGDSFYLPIYGLRLLVTILIAPCLSLVQFLRVNLKDVMIYGGGLWYIRFDRDLTLVGKIICQEGEKYTFKLWKSQRSLLKIPNLTIRLRAQGSKFKPNTETQLKPIISSETYQQQLNHAIEQEGSYFCKHNARLISMICEQLGIKVESIIDFDLYFADSQPPSNCGLDGDFIISLRLDNLFSSFHAVLALSQSPETFINMTTVFDHQECGSESAQGASSPIVTQTIRRVYKLLCGHDDKADNFQRTMQRSFLIQVDMASCRSPKLFRQTSNKSSSVDEQRSNNQVKTQSKIYF